MPWVDWSVSIDVIDVCVDIIESFFRNLLQIDHHLFVFILIDNSSVYGVDVIIVADDNGF